MRHLEADRKGKRDDYPIRAMWNSLLASFVFRHRSVGGLRRDLMRNGELRQVCGFDLVRRVQRVKGRERLSEGVPSKHAYRRFLLKLVEHIELVEALFDSLVTRLAELLPDFGRYLAADGKAILAARRDDPDAAVGYKKEGHPDGEETVEVTKSWLGYKLHMLCDARYELPIAFQVTQANVNESPLLTELMETVREKHEAILDRAEALCADKGYDDGADKASLYHEYGVAPVIPARDLKQGRYEPLRAAVHDTIYVSATGQVCCKIAPFEADDAKAFAPMQYMGFEEERGTLKFRCPAAAWGLECANRDACRCKLKVKNGTYGRVVRVRIDKDPRLFGPIYAHSYRFEDLYKMRTSVERLFFRLDHLYEFEHHHTVRLKRMRLRVTLALIAMQATAVGWIALGQADRIRCLRPAA